MSNNSPQHKEWNAWEDSQPIDPPTLIVTGKVMTENGALVPVLKVADSDGLNEKILLLNLTIEKQGDDGTADMSFRDARYEQNVSKGQYNKVQILWEGTPIVTLDVVPVQ